MEPMTLALIGGGMQGGASLLQLMEQRAARKDAKKQAKKQRQQDALFNLMSIIGGQGAQRPSPIQPLPQFQPSGSLSALGKSAMDMAQLQAYINKAQNSQKTTSKTIDADESWMKEYEV